MIERQRKKYIMDKEISRDEYDILEKFLNQYRNKNVIVADKHRVDFVLVPFEGYQIAFKSNKELWKSMNFQKRIIHNKKPYIVKLGLWRVNNQEKDPKCLTIKDFSIETPGKEHVLTLKLDNIYEEKILYNIISIFDEKKVISPEEAYNKRMYTNKPLQEFINNHEWNKILLGVNQKPDLANALFIIGEPTYSLETFGANFGTILYQLLKYRKEHEFELTKTDLLELDRTILELRKTELLRVHLLDSSGVSKSYPTKSILLDCNYESSQMRISEQYNVANGELTEEKMVLNKVLRESKNL